MRCYFDVRDGDQLVQDEEGTELPNLDLAAEEASKALGDLARDALREHTRRGGYARRIAIEVRTDDGPVLLAGFSAEIGRARR
jgi:hypothetical protein